MQSGGQADRSFCRALRGKEGRSEGSLATEHCLNCVWEGEFLQVSGGLGMRRQDGPGGLGSGWSPLQMLNLSPRHPQGTYAVGVGRY